MRLFVAVWPSEEVVRTLLSMARPETPGLRWTSEDQWHVTLRFLGSCDLRDVEPAFSRIAASPATAVMGPSIERFGSAVLHVPVEGLGSLAAAVLAATADVGEPPEDRPFRGHLTLARAPRRGPKVDLAPYVGQPLAGEWPVDEITLVSSKTGPQGATYEIVSRLPLSTAIIGSPAGPPSGLG